MAKVEFERDGKVGIIRLNRPEVRNCFDPETLTEFKAHLDTCRDETRVRVVMICGNGPAFSAGMDLKYAKDKDMETIRALNYKGLVETFAYLQNFPKPTLAVVQGYALGGGFELALSCDFRFASKEHAIFGFPEVDLGILPTWGGMFLPVDLIGPAKTMELVLMGNRIDAETAYSLGLVNRVPLHDRLFEDALQFAKELARKGSFLLQLAKYVIRKSKYETHSEKLETTTLAAELITMGTGREARLGSILKQNRC